MRYLSWDVLLFPQEGNDVKTPLQEFKTKCDVVQDSDSEIFSNISNTTFYNAVTRCLPTVSCYVPSLPYRSPFRVSLHCWAPPEATRATTFLESKDNPVVFEAKVLIDGECMACLVFRADAHWPQIIDDSEREIVGHVDNDRRLLFSFLASKDGRLDPLRFPAFHHEMLSQTWIVPQENMGRIKIVIAEGVSRGTPGSTAFKKTRNLVAFSFLHTPLHILEDSGIAWPNSGMFYQISYPDSNPLSPRKAKNADPDAHAHSPRRGALESAGAIPAKLEGTVAPQSLSKGVIHPGTTVLPPPFKTHRHQAGDPFLSQYYYHDSFNDTSEPAFQRHSFQGNTRQTSSSGDVSTPDVQTRSTTSDEVMADYIRPFSPIGRLNSYSLNQSSRPFSPEGYHTLSHFSPSVLRFPSPPCSRQFSKDSSLRESHMHRLLDELEVQSEGGAELPEQSQFVEMIDAMSPRKVSERVQYPLKNTRASSVAKTPPASTKLSVAAEARASAYNGKIRSISQMSCDFPKSNHTQTPFKVAPKAHTRPRWNESYRLENNAEDAHGTQRVTNISSSTKIKSKEENRANESGLEDADELQRIASAESTAVQDKDNSGVLQLSGGHKKRRRVNSKSNPGVTLPAQEANVKAAPEVSPNIDIQKNGPEKIAGIDELTCEETITRAPLGNLSNIA